MARRKASDVNKRQYQLVDLVREHGYVSIEALAKHLSVSLQTVRRDITFLSDQSLLERHHGGVGILPGTKSLAYTSRKNNNVDAKTLIGEAIAAKIPNGVSVFIDIGTTMEAVAHALIHHKSLTVITNHVGVALILNENTGFEIMIPGGLLRSRDRAITGEAATEFLLKQRVNYGVFGIGSITDDGHLLDYDYRDAQVSRVALDISRTKFSAADHTKFNAEAMMPIAHISEIDGFFTDQMPPEPIKSAIKSGQTDLFVGSTKIE